MMIMGIAGEKLLAVPVLSTVLGWQCERHCEDVRCEQVGK